MLHICAAAQHADCVLHFIVDCVSHFTVEFDFDSLSDGEMSHLSIALVCCTEANWVQPDQTEH